MYYLTKPSPKLWFDRTASALGLPLWFGTCIIGLIPAAALWLLGIKIRIATDFTGVPIVSLPLLVVNVVFLLGASQLIRARTLQLRVHTLSVGGQLKSDQTNKIVSLKAISLLWVVLLCTTSLVFDPYVFSLYYSPYQEMLRLLVTSYLRLIQATFLWVLGYAMYLVYRWGKLPVKLKCFAEDRTLGLNIYGRASLFFVTLYIIGMLLTFPIFVYKSEAVIWSQMIFSFLGLVIFLAPLFSLRKKLKEAKGEKLAWIQKRHTRVIESIESSGDGPIDSALVNELIAVDSIRNDLQRISGWPFNAGVVAKLVTVVVLPLALVLLSNYLIHVLNV
jgi:hypothetical protein